MFYLIIITYFLQDTQSFFSPAGKTAKEGASKVENMHSKDSTAKSLSKHDVGKSLTKRKVSNGLCSIWERKLFALSGNSTSVVTEKRSAHIIAPVWLNRSWCVSMYSAIHIPIYLLREGGGGTPYFTKVGIYRQSAWTRVRKLYVYLLRVPDTFYMKDDVETLSSWELWFRLFLYIICIFNFYRINSFIDRLERVKIWIWFNFFSLVLFVFKTWFSWISSVHDE